MALSFLNRKWKIDIPCQRTWLESHVPRHRGWHSKFTAYGLLGTGNEFGGGACCSPIGELRGRAETPAVSEVLTGLLNTTGAPRLWGVWARRGLVWCAQQNLPGKAGEAEIGLVTEFTNQGTYLFSEGFFHTSDSLKEKTFERLPCFAHFYTLEVRRPSLR